MLFKPSIIVGFLACWSLTVLAIDQVEEEKQKCYEACWKEDLLCDCLKMFCDDPFCEGGRSPMGMAVLYPEKRTKCQSTCDESVRETGQKCKDKCDQQYPPEQPKA